MCEANAYLIEGEENRLVMEAVDVVEPENDGVRLISIFGDQKFLKARIHSLSLVDHKIFLKMQKKYNKIKEFKGIVMDR